MVRNYKRKTEDRWSKEDLLEALICIKEAKLEINDAAVQYGISRATLYRHYQKFILAGGTCDVNQFRTCGGNPILTKVEEDALEKTIRDLREQGFTVTSSDIKRICFEYCDSNGIPNQFNQEKRMASDDWYYGFLKRHPDVRIPKPGGGGKTHGIPQGSASGTSVSSDIDVNSSTAILTSAEKMSKKNKNKTSPAEKSTNEERASTSKMGVQRSPAFTRYSKVTAVKKDRHFQQHEAPILIPMEAAVGHLRKPLKRLSAKSNGKSRGRKQEDQDVMETEDADEEEDDDEDEEVDVENCDESSGSEVDIENFF